MKRIFYGWWMAGAGSLMQFVQGTLLLHSFGAYFAVLRDDRGWSKTELSGAAALHQVEAAILGPLLGWFIDRFGPQWVIRIGVLIFGAGFMLLSTIDSLLAFYGAFIVTALGASLCGFFPLNVALIHWFEKKRARALSSMQIGMAAGGLCVPLVAWALATWGWRATSFASGIIIIALCLPLSFVIRRRPEDMGEVMDGVGSRPSDSIATSENENAASTRDFTAREALRTPAFWLISLGHGFALFVVMGVNTHAIIHMKEGLGYTIEAAALVITLQTVAQLCGVGVGAWVGDRLNKRLMSAACMLGHMGGLLFLTYASNVAMVVAYALLHGAAWGLRGPMMQAIRADYFGRSAIGMILGLSFLIMVIGQVGGPMIAGIMADITGNYRAGFTTLALLAGLGSVFFLLAKRPPRPMLITGAAR
ncbi:MAG: MFS transporter [Betaproteobacteria bacterium]|nr:MFS transporter [Betaproteobacteria bacterium]MSQ88186.1 MFS transporter [Betaproteobacteria bacterium]